MSHQTKPSQHGWTKTGENATSRVEFYQKDNVKMDYYPTTGKRFIVSPWPSAITLRETFFYTTNAHSKKAKLLMLFAPIGTVKTSMNHPSQGSTQMFRRDLSQADFQNVCENPRYHTGQGYQRKQ